tara:strand:+ start:233 stop:985 length:753 start_codon:yes stop_codon:yes gene_type:complete
MKYLLIICSVIIFSSCKPEEKKRTAQQIVDKTIANAGGENYGAAMINFTFRNTKYSSKRRNGQYEFTRTITDSLGETLDVLTNTGFERYVNANKIIVPDSTATKYANSVNSVHYFVQLPYGLNDPAVKKELVGNAEIEGEKYYEIQVTFEEDSGGTDHEDVYMYWINQQNFTVDYFAYKFYTGDGGIRFRKAYNPRMVNGIRFVDYENYKLEPWKTVDLKTVDSLYLDGKLELLSEIKTENISVEILENK